VVGHRGYPQLHGWIPPSQVISAVFGALLTVLGEAKPLYDQALGIFEVSLGIDHPRTIACRSLQTQSEVPAPTLLLCRTLTSD